MENTKKDYLDFIGEKNIALHLDEEKKNNFITMQSCFLMKLTYELRPRLESVLEKMGHRNRSVSEVRKLMEELGRIGHEAYVLLGCFSIIRSVLITIPELEIEKEIEMLQRAVNRAENLSTIAKNIVNTSGAHG